MVETNLADTQARPMYHTCSHKLSKVGIGYSYAYSRSVLLVKDEAAISICNINYITILKH